MNRNFILVLSLAVVAAFILVALSAGSRGRKPKKRSAVAADNPAENAQQETFANLDSILKRLKADPVDSSKLRAILSLSNYGDQFDKIVFPLAKALASRDQLENRAAKLVVEGFGDSIVEPLKEMLRSTNGQVLLAACELIHAVGPPAAPCVEPLIEMLQSKNPLVVEAAVYALINIGPQAADAVEHLVPILDDADFRNQILALRALESIGPKAVPAAEKVAALLEKGNGSVRGHASMALAAMGDVEGMDINAMLGKQLEAFLMPEKQRALIAISKRGQASQPLLPRIKKLMEDSTKSVPIEATLAYWKASGDTETALDWLKRYAKNLDYEYEAIEAMGEMGPAAAPAIPFLVELLASGEGNFGMQIAETLSKMGSAAAPAKDALEALASAGDPLTRAYAIRALLKIAGK